MATSLAGTGKVVDGQIQGGVAQGIGTALYEQMIYDENGQLLTGTLMDYLPPTATEVPQVERWSGIYTLA